MDAEAAVEKSIYTLADAYLAGFADGYKVQKAESRSTAEAHDNGGSRSPSKATAGKKSAKEMLVEKEELADAAVEWAVRYLAQGEDRATTSPDSINVNSAGETFADHSTMIQPAMPFPGQDAAAYEEEHWLDGEQEDSFALGGSEDGRGAAGLATEDCGHSYSYSHSQGQGGSSGSMTGTDSEILTTAPF